MRREARALEHVRRVPAHEHRAPRLEHMVVVEREEARRVRRRAAVDSDLPEVLTLVLEVELEGAHRAGRKRHARKAPSDRGVVDGQHPLVHRAVVKAPDCAERAAKVLDVHRAPQALAEQHRVRREVRGDAAVAEDV